jgi:hypothetical protein
LNANGNGHHPPGALDADAGGAPGGPRVGPLDTMADVKREAGRLYRAARRGDVPAADASRMASVLALIARCVEGSDFEARLSALEGDREVEGGKA